MFPRIHHIIMIVSDLRGLTSVNGLWWFFSTTNEIKERQRESFFIENIGKVHLSLTAGVIFEFFTFLAH